jgi:hypothetical protein
MTEVINFFAGPGSGKSTLAAGLFSEMKWKGCDVELVTEFAKDLVWENRGMTLDNQIYVTAKQYNRIWRLLGQVEYIIVDSPIMLGIVYRNKVDGITEDFELMVSAIHHSLLNKNYFVERIKPYKQPGRVQSEKESLQLDKDIKNMLKEFSIDYKTIPGKKESIDTIIRDLCV